jgi:hypothetical protein
VGYLKTSRLVEADYQQPRVRLQPPAQEDSQAEQRTASKLTDDAQPGPSMRPPAGPASATAAGTGTGMVAEVVAGQARMWVRL